MSRIEKILKAYEHFVSLPWPGSLSGAEKTWFLIYDPHMERRIRASLDELELSTTKAGHRWLLIDLSDTFPTWMAGQEYRDEYFQNPADLDLLLPEFREAVITQIKDRITNEADGNTVVCLLGVATLFGLQKVSDILSEVVKSIPGRLLVLFPGEFEHNNYRLLDARDGWNYLAVPITAESGE